MPKEGTAQYLLHSPEVDSQQIFESLQGKEQEMSDSAGRIPNAGLRLWEIQKAQGTGLCIGLDPHYDPRSGLDAQFYIDYANDNADSETFLVFENIADVLERELLRDPGNHRANSLRFLTGVTQYFLNVIEAAWKWGLRVFKPQMAFFERFQPFGPFILEILCKRLDDLTAASGEPHFKILDAKRNDIFSTQAAYYDAYLTACDQEVFPRVFGRYDFDAMTVTTWMGDDVLTPALPFLQKGKGVIVVTRTSNPSGTTLQDAAVKPCPFTDLSDKQRPFEFTQEVHDEIEGIIADVVTAHEVVLYQTTKFSQNSELDQDGVSPIFSVMGATVKMSASFRDIRGNGAIALVPGFGAQGGAFDRIEPLLVKEGPLAGHWGILSSSRAHNYPWMEKYGGMDDPDHLREHMSRVIKHFKAAERAAYAAAGVDYPF